MRIKNNSSSQAVQAIEAQEQMQSASPLPLRILSHNVRYATDSPFPGEEKWPIRRPRLCKELVFHTLNLPSSFICLQEVLHRQLVDIEASLNASAQHGQRWAYIGGGRDDGKQAGEYSPIFYRPSVWRLHKSGTFWLSPTPDVPSRGWDAALPRIVTHGSFVHVETGKGVVVASTHLDHLSVVARAESAKLLLKFARMSKRAGPAEAPIDAPVLLAGDFNSPPEDAAYQIMTDPDSGMLDVKTAISEEKSYGHEMTFTSFGEKGAVPTRIDFVFHDKGGPAKLTSYAVLENKFDDGVYCSDHRAVVADFGL